MFEKKIKTKISFGIFFGILASLYSGNFAFASGKGEEYNGLEGGEANSFSGQGSVSDSEEGDSSSINPELRDIIYQDLGLEVPHQESDSSSINPELRDIIYQDLDLEVPHQEVNLSESSSSEEQEQNQQQVADSGEEDLGVVKKVKPNDSQD
ncbi:hypothetical protein [Holospora undulata]|nr:hypothetical protein [Holospora undulata]